MDDQERLNKLELELSELKEKGEIDFLDIFPKNGREVQVLFENSNKYEEVLEKLKDKYGMGHNSKVLNENQLNKRHINISNYKFSEEYINSKRNTLDLYRFTLKKEEFGPPVGGEKKKRFWGSLKIFRI